MKRTVHITEKQLNKMGLPKKVRQNLIPYGDGEEHSPNYSLSSSNGDLGDAHVVGGDAGAICESEGSTIETLYRGFYRKLGLQRTHILWLTTNPVYAASYGDTVAEFKINTDLCNGDVFDLGEGTDYYDGPSWEESQELLKQGINSYWFEADNFAETLVLWDKAPIVGKPRILSTKEVKELLKKHYDDLEYVKSSYQNLSDELFGESRNERGNLITEALDPNFDLTPYFNSYNDFLIRNGYNIKPLPAVNLDNSDQGDPVMIKTGYYLPDENSITLFVKDRHPKDILRSYAHEMVHRIQNNEDPNRDWGSGKDLSEDDVLSEIESDAYERGNMLFRKWTEELKKHPDNRLNEAFDVKRALKNIRKRMDPAHIDKRFDKDDVNEATMNDVDLSSFKVRETLNPKIWKDGKIDSRVRVKLMDISDEFFDFLGISWVKRLDTIIVGSIANYNWSKFSDIDLHLVIDFSEIDSRKKFVEDFLNTKKREWNNEHGDIRIYGYPVELYVQDKDAEVASSGIYSIEDNKWIKEPERGHFSKKDIDSYMVKKKASDIMTKIENFENSSNGLENDSQDSRSLYKKTDELIGDITRGRKEKLASEKDEMGIDNIVFKVLRRNGYLDKLFKLRDKTYNKTMSL